MLTLPETPFVQPGILQELFRIESLGGHYRNDGCTLYLTQGALSKKMFEYFVSRIHEKDIAHTIEIVTEENRP